MLNLSFAKRLMPVSVISFYIVLKIIYFKSKFDINFYILHGNFIQLTDCDAQNRAPEFLILFKKTQSIAN